MNLAERDIEVGDVFAVRLNNRRYGLCQVVWFHDVDWQQVSFVLLDGWFESPPTMAEVQPRLLEVQHPHYLGYAWLRMLRPSKKLERFAFVGHFPLAAGATEFPVGDDWDDPDQRFRTTDWRAFDHMLLREYRWRHDAKYRRRVEAEPKPGDLYTRPGEDGWRVCRVVRVVGRVEVDRYATRRYLVGYSQRFAQKPTLEHALTTLGPLEQIRSRTTTTDSKPADVELLGNVAVADDELELEFHSIGSWQHVV